MKQKGIIFGSVVAAVALAAALLGGIAMAQTPPASGPGSAAPSGGARPGIDSFLNGLAQNLGIDRSTLDNALKTTAKQQVDQAVASGKLTQDQANRIDQRIDSGQGFFGVGAGFGRSGQRGGEQGGANRTAMGACGSAMQQAVTSTLGVSSSELQQDRRNGESIAQIAQDHGTSAQSLQTAVVGAAQGCLDAQVQAGNLTADEEQRILQRLQSGSGFLGGAGEHGHRGPSQQSGGQ
jgi:polyhydroxyalkanoate synthesis regulator phasin